MDSVFPVCCIVLSGLGMDMTSRSYASPAGFMPNQRHNCLKTFEGCTKVFTDLLGLPPSYLGRNDFGMQNLLCANDLPGSEDIDIPNCLTRLDNLTAYVKRTMDRNFHLQKAHPDYGHCEPMWRIASLVTSVKRDFGACYDPVIRDEIAAGTSTSISDSSKMFINGLLADDPKQRWGTCASIPALITAVARRLHYPVGLAVCGRHIYAKWEGRDGLCFNIEASNPMGVTFPTDDECKEKISKHQIWKSTSDNGYYIRTLHPAEELGLYLFHSCRMLDRRCSL